MKLIFVGTLCIMILFGIIGFRAESRAELSEVRTDSTISGAQNTENAEVATDSGARRLKMTVNGHEIMITLYDTPAANSLYAMLPLKLTFKDYNGIEKISDLPKALTTDGEPRSFDPNVGDLCLYAPWGNLSIFYRDFRLSNGLISLGRINSGMDIISAMKSDFDVTLERVEQ